MTRARDLAAGTFELATGGVLKLETSDTTVTDGSVLGKIEFKAPDEASGTDANLTAAAIEAVAEGTFAADNNATELVFKTGASAAADAKMILDSSGNLLVGHTAEGTWDANNSAILRASGVATFTSTSTPPLYGNRLSNDGDIVSLRKDGSTVGSIGAKSDDLYITTGDTGIRFNDGNDQIWPVGSSGTSRDAAIDLGASGVRFKDLYLSGGVFLGGTGAANKLDDYEEGTWTPGINGRTFTSAFGKYTKIGNTVHLQFDCNTMAGGAITNPVLTGLPFASTNSSAVQYGGYLYIMEPNAITLSTGYYAAYWRIDKNATTNICLQNSGEGHASGVVFNNSTNFRGSGFYYTDA